MKIAVVGPTGVLGHALIPLLLGQGHTVRALARSTSKAQALFPADVEIVACDLLSPDIDQHLVEMLAGCDAAIHIATAIPRDFAAPNAWEANTRLRTNGVELLLKASLEVGVKRYIQQSITLAYPDHGEAWITEDAPLDTSAERAAICGPVITMEELVRNVSPKALQWCILRGGTFVGPGTLQDTIIQNIRFGDEVIPGDGQNFLSLIHVADMAGAIVAALELAPAGTVFNIVDYPIRQAEYYDRLAISIGAVKPRRDETAARALSLRCSNQAAKSTLKWMPVHSLIPE